MTSRLIFLILGLVVFALSVSSPNPTLIYLCNATSERFGCADWNPETPTICPDSPQPIMWWAKKTTRSNDYRISVGKVEGEMQTTYTPGIYVDVHVRAVKYGFAYRGILLYAENSQGEKVGDWNLDGEEATPNFLLPFTSGGPCEKSLMHHGAREKPYYYVFKFKAPPAGTGPITFRCLIKYGYANTGAFYWPNLEGDIVMQEGVAVESHTNWVQGSVGLSCDSVCQGLSQSCDESSLKEYSGDTIHEIGETNVCKGPTMATCSNYPSTSTSGFCYVAADKSTCMSENKTLTQPQCSDSFNMAYKRFCPCSGSERNFSFFGLVILALFWISSPISGSGKRSGSFNTTFLLCFLITLSLVQYSSAHNWIASRSRYFGASTKVPCHLGSEKPHVQVGPGQSFEAEWMTGHGSSTYFTLVSEENEEKLNLISEKLLDTYLKNAPSNMAQTPQYRKYHRSRGNSTTIKVSVNNVETSYFLKELVPPTDPNYVGRPLSLRPQSPTNLFNYMDTDLDQDAYASYTNPNYTWILAVWRYEHSVPHPGEFDVTNFEIPASAPTGRYILHYFWRGYYDCIDVEKLNTQVPFIYGEHFPLNTTWQRIDHCYFPKPRDIRSNCAEIVNSIDYCLRRCYEEFESCNGVQVLPVHSPLSVYKDFQPETLIPWEKGWCYDRFNGDISQEGKAEEEFRHTPNDTYLCYALLARTPTELISEYVVNEDPDDPIFYGTCYIKKEFIKMIGYDIDSNEAPSPKQWRFNHKCLTCENYEENKLKNKFNDVPIWKIADQCRDCDLEKATPPKKPVSHLIRKDAICDGLTTNGWGSGNTTIHTNCTDKTLACSKRIYPLNQRSYLSLDECIVLAKRDQSCSKVITIRQLPNDTRTQQLKQVGSTTIYTECYCYFDRPCCLECSSRRSAGFEIHSLDEPTPDPKCSSGVIAADGLGCCSASCGTGNCGTNTNTVVQVGHCCATTACGVTRSCDQYGPPCRMSQFANATGTTTS